MELRTWYLWFTHASLTVESFAACLTSPGIPMPVLQLVVALKSETDTVCLA